MNTHKIRGGYLATYFRKLNECGVRYCVLRNYWSLPQSSGGSDVDIWVHEDDVEKTFRICEETKTECGYHLVSRYGDATAEKLCFQREDDGVQFDLFRGAIYYRNRMFINGDTILRHIHDYQGVCVLDDNFADLIAFLKEILNNGKCASKYVAPVIGNEVFSENYLKDNLCNFSPTFAEKIYLFIINQ